jgi:hypothetical protein
MPGSYPARPRTRTPFLVTPYTAGIDGRLAAELPTCCPHTAAGERCKVSIHDQRRRKTGPIHPLAVARCAAHDASFTLYPPGFAPYQRQAVQHLSPDGQEMTPELKDGEPAAEWRGTLFEAAVDGKEGHAWSRSSDEAPGAERWWGTQGRHLRRSASLLGVACDLADRVREAIGATLSIGTLVLRELSAATGYRAIGRAVCDVLSHLRGGAGRALRLLVCGHLAGQWGAPWRWDPARRVVERSPFLSGGTTGGG